MSKMTIEEKNGALPIPETPISPFAFSPMQMITEAKEIGANVRKEVGTRIETGVSKVWEWWITQPREKRHQLTVIGTSVFTSVSAALLTTLLVRRLAKRSKAR